MRALRRAALFLAIVGAGLVLAGYGGSIHGASDSLSLGRPVFALLTLIGVFAARSKWARTGFGLIALFAAVSVVPPLLRQEPGGDVKLYSKNVLARNDAVDALAEDILASRVDVVLLQEVSTGNDGLLTQLQGAFPHQHLCRFSVWIGIAVLSRTPFLSKPHCSSQRALAAAQVQIGGTDVWVVSAHIPWLWPVDSTDAEAAAEALLAGLDGPIVIAGDFNAFPWTARVQRIVAASGTRLAGPVRPTYHLRNMPLPIDLALAPGGGSVRYRPRLGSDHRGLVADLSLAGN